MDVVVAAHYPITGVHTGIDPQTGARPARRNILDLQNDLPAWSLFIQAVSAMQQAPENELLSWFQVAGIHGRPQYAWDGYEQHPDAPLSGYCTHSNVLFPTWHRPYLALIEQVIAGHAQNIAKLYSSATYQTAADNLRLPYWDFSSIPTMPDVLNTATVSINTPSGLENVTNPLLLYKFQEFPLNSTWFPNDDSVSLGERSLSQLRITMRLPFNGESSPDSANSNLRNARPSLMQGTYNVFAKSKAFYDMATTAGPGTSFEAVHNTVHAEVGGRTNGHMAAVGYSAFDPIFWLTHSNVDRLFAMWQAIYPDVYLLPQVDNTGTFTIPIGSIDTETTPLTPFTTGDGQTTYTSLSSRYLKDFGYSYPEIQDWIPMSKEELAANVTSQVNKMYNPNGTFTKRRRGLRAKRGDPVVREWSVAAKVSSAAIGERFVIRIFLGAPPSDPAGWDVADNLVGNMFVSKLPGEGTPDVNNEFSLQDALVRAGIGSADVNKVTSYLEGNLIWGVQKADNTIVPNSEVEGLLVAVYDEAITLPKDDTELPIYGEKIPHPEVTQGKSGGAK
ncbi:hypothetical protein B0O99DRAFT_524064 [Bisporella sp. PMI_857]|nr:hypothetical protein B0O99DRAFT_524064 [Bisporella sp. PMI_857]